MRFGLSRLLALPELYRWNLESQLRGSQHRFLAELIDLYPGDAQISILVEADESLVSAAATFDDHAVKAFRMHWQHLQVMALLDGVITELSYIDGI